jgi:predicted Fe-Mo cluster-binding NifX family protein
MLSHLDKVREHFGRDQPFDGQRPSAFDFVMYRSELGVERSTLPHKRAHPTLPPHIMQLRLRNSISNIRMRLCNFVRRIHVFFENANASPSARCGKRFAACGFGTPRAIQLAVITLFTVWDGRIAPVFDTAREACLVESAGGRIVSEKRLSLSPEAPSKTVAWLQEWRVNAVVCGAISRPLQERLAAVGITVVPFVAGDLRQVIHASFDGTLSGAAFTMPGCCGRRRMRRICGRRNF